MDVFGLHDQLIDDYSNFTRSFVDIADSRVHEAVERGIDGGALWPDPWVQLNPSFEPGDSAAELAEQGVLHNDAEAIFRVKEDRGDPGKTLRFHRHQSEAIRTAATGANYVLTTGTGSGKSLAYIAPIVDRALRERPGQGIRALVVYPMNALANSQFGELEKFLNFGFPVGGEPVSYARYTGQEGDDERERIVAHPPDILLTNYMMLELILTRPRERDRLVRAARGQLRFLVLDELHTYRGRQGADVAMLVRRVRDACDAPDLQCVGTSATMAAGGSETEQRAEVASVASRLFGAVVKPEHVIGETLRRVTQARDFADPAGVASLAARVLNGQAPTAHQAFLDDPLASWLETTLGLDTSGESGELIRRRPRTISGDDGIAVELSELTGVDERQCVEAIRATLLAGYQAVSADTPRPPFAFRIHQFITKGDTAYATLEPEDRRYITLEAQFYQPGDRSKVLLPLAFCRECGEEYFTVSRQPHGAFLARDVGDLGKHSEGDAGFLHLDSESLWPEDSDALRERVPESWLVEESGTVLIDRNRRKEIPQPIDVDPDGTEGDGLRMTWIPAPFRFCLSCGVSYDPRVRSDLSKLSLLSAEGRSSATSMLSLSLIRSLRCEGDLDDEARKLLSFSDNRQDAALQAGHFNDFVEVGLLRGALYRAVAKTGDGGLRSDRLVLAVFDALGLPFDAYAADPDVRFAARRRTEQALQGVLGYRLFHDLQRGWRVTMPNLEQSGLVYIDYESLDELADDGETWQGTHPILQTADASTRKTVCRVLLDDLRRNLAIHVNWLDADEQDAIKHRSYQQLNDRWAIDPGEELTPAAVAFPRPRRRYDARTNHFLSGRGGVARWLRRRSTFPDWLGARLSVDDSEQVIGELLEALRIAGLVQVAHEPRDDSPVGYQVVAGSMRWLPGSGEEPFHDHLRMPDRPGSGGRTNPFFVRFYREVAATLTDLEAREHTAQVRAEVRIEREEEFREARLPILYCSPTMELGVDIAQLNAVHLRNVPPTPANYAQRSGRAGRSGQPAIVTTYCAAGSPHDQYFFRRSDQMVSGAVAPPRLELANEDLVRAHVHAIWLSEVGIELGRSMRDVLDLDKPTYPLRAEIQDSVATAGAVERTRLRAQRLLASLGGELKRAHWFSDRWLDDALTNIGARLDDACNRWRDLYRAATDQAREQTKVAQDASAGQRQKERARRLRHDAESQQDLLTSDSSERSQSDFYPYRYLASEGFLPGYSFPRLPLSAYIPGHRSQHGYLSRPRFLAISEFGPGALIYHEGSRYQIEKVVLPAGDLDEDGRPPLSSVKQCHACGYLHPYTGNAGKDVCDRCGEQLGAPLSRLLRMQNVVTRRRQRVNSDEEERLRSGFELRTGVMFASGRSVGGSQTAALWVDSDQVAALTYGDAATIWRINLGWRRRADRDRLGYVLDLDSGRWLSDETLSQPADELPSYDPQSGQTRMERVIPFVEDTRNALLFEPAELLDAALLASLTAALKTGIQAEFQLEDGELAAEPLPTEDDRRSLLFFEAAEGGAGALRRLLDEPEAWRHVVDRAVERCHYDPATGEDQRHAPSAREDCEVACYDCLMSYTNQRDHRLLDRHLAVEALRAWREAATVASTASRPRQEHLATLIAGTDSHLEQAFLRLLDELEAALPSHAQKAIDACQARPDFLYAADYTAVFVDGPHHDEPDQRSRDATVTACLEDMGYAVLRFRYDQQDAWEAQMRANPSLFKVQR